MMRSMYSGVSGLRIHQTKMDVIGNNIANVNTVGFKSSRVTFSEVFSQTVQGASGANENQGGRNPMQIGLGSNISSIDVNMTEGAAQRTDNPLDLKVEGDGFFVVSDATGNKFTKAGAFRVDVAGNLVSPEGLNLMGWQTDPSDDTKIVKSKVSKLKVMDVDNMYVEPEATSNITMSGNINKNDEQLMTPNVREFTLTFFDELGYKYTATLNIAEVNPAVAAPPIKEYTITLPANSVDDENGNAVGPAAPSSVVVQMDESTGKLSTAAASTGFNIDMTALNSFINPIAVDFSKLTMFSGNTTVGGDVGDADGVGAGNRAGTLSGYEIGGDGKITGRYTNGDTKLLGQVVVANFKNAAGLQKLGNNLYETTSNSGEFDGIGEDITTNGGTINSGVLEMSNVDLSREFTDMITTQRGFQANSRIITASDEILQELVNLKR